jgi:CDP-diacylglycerol--glycerol-3-phosphate 3-phosphatidyltransferase
MPTTHDTDISPPTLQSEPPPPPSPGVERAATPTPLFGPPGWRGKAPNWLTILRLLLAAAFFAVLSLYAFPSRNEWALLAGAVLFVVAALTDAADGYLARRWQAVSVFGRVMDPFADKVLVLGAFVMLAGPQFAGPDGRSMSGVVPWMAIVILARELLVTSIRGVCEARGIDFSASATGKAKMVLQSIAAPAILLVLWAPETTPGSPPVLNVVIAWAVVAVTVASAIPYVVRGYAGLTSLYAPPRGS